MYTDPDYNIPAWIQLNPLCFINIYHPCVFTEGVSEFLWNLHHKVIIDFFPIQFIINTRKREFSIFSR